MLLKPLLYHCRDDEQFHYRKYVTPWRYCAVAKTSVEYYTQFTGPNKMTVTQIVNIVGQISPMLDKRGLLVPCYLFE